MKPISRVKPLGVALIVATIAVTSMAGFGAALRKRATLGSHQQPMAEQWLEETTPTSPQLIVNGRKLFLDSCAHCHGADASGDEGPDLHGVEVSDRYIGNIIARGFPHEMPSFAKKLGHSEISALTAYVRSLEGS
ncbi:MAG: c-type cytochrome [Lacunisphaera sp.]